MKSRAGIADPAAGGKTRQLPARLHARSRREPDYQGDWSLIGIEQETTAPETVPITGCIGESNPGLAVLDAPDRVQP